MSCVMDALSWAERRVSLLHTRQSPFVDLTRVSCAISLTPLVKLTLDVGAQNFNAYQKDTDMGPDELR